MLLTVLQNLNKLTYKFYLGGESYENTSFEMQKWREITGFGIILKEYF
jgi:hypothetical protein